MSRASPRSTPSTVFERGLRRAGVLAVAGLDEAGRGALAGPVVAAAVILPGYGRKVAKALSGVRDSKQMTAPARAGAYERIRKIALASAIGVADNGEVDSLGIVPATRLAMTRALEVLEPVPDHLLLDYMLLPDWPSPQTSLIRGDSLVLSIAAASVLAKVARDRMMVSFHHRFPGYALKSNKGYGTAAHRTALRELGPCPIHRRTFAPILHLEHANGGHPS